MKKIHDHDSTSTDARKGKPVANTANDSEAVAAKESATENDKHTPLNAVKLKDKKTNKDTDAKLAAVREEAKDALKKYDEACSKARLMTYLNESPFGFRDSSYENPSTADSCRLIDKATAQTINGELPRDCTDIAKSLIFAKVMWTMFVRCKNARKNEFVRLCRKLVSEFEKDPDRFAEEIDEAEFRFDGEPLCDDIAHEDCEQEMIECLPPTLLKRIRLGVDVCNFGGLLVVNDGGVYLVNELWTPLELQLILLYHLFDSDLEPIAELLDQFLYNISDHFLAFHDQDDGTTFFRMDDESTSDASKKQDAV